MRVLTCALGKTFHLKRDATTTRSNSNWAADAFNVLNRVNYKNFVGITTSPFFSGDLIISADPRRAAYNSR